MQADQNSESSESEEFVSTSEEGDDSDWGSLNEGAVNMLMGQVDEIEENGRGIRNDPRPSSINNLASRSILKGHRND